MKKIILFFAAIFYFPLIFAKPVATKVTPSMSVSLVNNGLTAGLLDFTLTLTNNGDEALLNVDWSNNSSGIAFDSYLIPYFGPGQIQTIHGTKPFLDTECEQTNFVMVSASTIDNTPVNGFSLDTFTAPKASPPIITSVITQNCYQVPVTGNMQITLSGLPSGNWTLHTDSTSYTYSGTGSTVTLNIDAATVGNGFRFYYDGSNGCPSKTSEYVTRNQIHGYDNTAPMYATYTDSNTNGIVNAGDLINYQILIKNTSSCPLDDVRVNGISSACTNCSLSFSGNPNTSASVPGYSTFGVLATYIITQQNINDGYVINSTSVNPHWSDALGGSSSTYYPSCLTYLSTLEVTDVTFKNFTSYPNPVQTIWHMANESSIDKVEIVTMLGQYIRTITVNNLSSDIDLSDLSSGTYMARIMANQKVKFVKIIKS
jgi:Secretion system C-terminal sorting domain